MKTEISWTPIAAHSSRIAVTCDSELHGRHAECPEREEVLTYLIVFLGGGIGAALRHGVNIASMRFLGTAFPFATMIENVSGSLVMGVIAGYFAVRGGGSHWQLFLTTGILGGYTTFSAFSLDTVLLYERGALGLATVYVVGSVILSIAGLIAGLALARQVF
jgi:CrcB protein